MTSVSSGGTESCGTTVDGRIDCWDLEATTVLQTYRVGNISDAVEVSVGDGTVCALHRDGGVSCWGKNGVGQVGDGTISRRPEPVRL